jgi:hypothetical protein
MGIQNMKLNSTKEKSREFLISVHSEDGTERSRAKTIFEKAGAEGISSTSEARV